MDYRFGHGSRFNPPLERRARLLRGFKKRKLTAILYGTYNVLYSWPPPESVLDEPHQMRLFQPSILEAALVGCSCGPEVTDRFHPVKVQYLENQSVLACKLVNCESQVLESINRTTCHCGQSIGDKFVALPINEYFLLFYQRQPNVVYTEEVPFTCLLLVIYLPSEAEIHKVIEGLEIAKIPGGITFRPRNEE